MKFLKLSNSSSKAIVDDEDFSRCLNLSWRITPNGYVCSNKHPQQLLHRFVLNLVNTKIETDHRNANLLDNRKSELRICNSSQNKHNQRKTRGKSKYKGVSWHKQNSKWQVHICYLSKRKNLGTYENEILAARIYDIWAKHYFGEFALTNFK